MQNIGGKEMKGPDKIYISEYNANVETGYFSCNKDDVFTQEYICKDALLEWADNWRKLGVVSEDFLYAMKILVQHLNSM